MIKAARDELRKGADHIKIMVSGGVASPPIRWKACNSASTRSRPRSRRRRAGAPTSAPTPTAPKAIARAVRAGVRTIEHGNLIDAPTAQLMAERGAFMVPTLVDLRCAEAARRGLRPVAVQPGEERAGAGGRPALAGDLPRGRREDRLWQRPAGPVAERPLQRVHDPRAR